MLSMGHFTFSLFFNLALAALTGSPEEPVVLMIVNSGGTEGVLLVWIWPSTVAPWPGYYFRVSGGCYGTVQVWARDTAEDLF
jgi:hypothetical protein